MNSSTLKALADALWPDGDRLDGPQVYWLLDGARNPEISRLVRGGRLEYACLYSGILHPRLEAAAPYLVHLSANSPTTDNLLQRGWGKGWGIFAVSPAHVSLTRMRLHFKTLLRVQTEDGTQLVFRYYDPAVMNLYLPTCTSEEISILFGPITRLMAEGDQGSKLFGYKVEEAVLKTSTATISPESGHDSLGVLCGF